MSHRSLSPSGWKRGLGYSHGIAASGRLVFVAGQIGWNADQQFQSDDLVEQARLALENTKAVLEEAGASPKDVARMTWYVVDKRDYQHRAQEIGAVYREVMGKHFPAMTLVEVKSLLEDRAKVEIETTAVVSEERT